MSHFVSLARAIGKMNEWIAKASSWLIVPIVVATAYEVVMRYVFQAPTIWSFEFNYLVFGVYFMLAGAYTYATGGHVNVDIVYGRLDKRGKALCDLCTAPLFFIFVSLMLWQGGKMAMDSWNFRENLSSAWAPPLYPFKMIIPVAAFMLLLQGIAKLIADIRTVLRGGGDPS